MNRLTDIQEIQIYLEQVYKHPRNISQEISEIDYLELEIYLKDQFQ